MSTAQKNLTAFIEDFKDEGTRNKLGPALVLITPGHWDRLIRWGAAHGYAITAADIQQEIVKYPRLLAAFAAHPRMKGWSLGSLKTFAGQAH